MITSRSNQQLKKIKKLLNSSKERNNTGLFVAEGARLCREAPGELLEGVYVSSALRIDISCFKNAEVIEKEIFDQISDTVSPQGVLAVIRQPKWSVSLEEKGRILLLDGIRDPGNLGTIIRTAEAAGVKAVFLSPDCVDLYNPKVIRSTMGSIFRVPVITEDLSTTIARLKGFGYKVYGTSLKAARSFKDVDLSYAAIVIGSEASGISIKTGEALDENIIIPMEGEVESLNAAVSAAILMFC